MNRLELQERYDLISKALQELRTTGKRTQCPKCLGEIVVESGVIYGTDIKTHCNCGFCNEDSRGINYFAFDGRAGIRALTSEDIDFVKNEFKAIDGDISMLVVDRTGAHHTCYDPVYDTIIVGSNVFPDLTQKSALETMSVRAVLGHELYGHRPRREEYNRGLWKERWLDDAVADRDAAYGTPNLSGEDRYKLLQSSMDRCAREGQKHILNIDELMLMMSGNTTYEELNKIKHNRKHVDG